MTDDTPTIAQYWDAAASSFDEEPDHGLRAEPTRAAWARRLAAWLPRKSGSDSDQGPLDVLDVGCGTGSLSLLLAQAGHLVTGVDLAPRMIEVAREKLESAGYEARFLVGDAAAPPIGAERFDVLVARHLLWTLPEPEAALRTWVGRLRPGGRLILIEGRWGESDPDAQPADQQPYAAGAEALPWGGGIGANALAAAVRPLVADLRIEPLSGDPVLWGKPVHDERYALLARI